MRPRRFFFADIVELHSRTGEAMSAGPCLPAPICRPVRYALHNKTNSVFDPARDGFFRAPARPGPYPKRAFAANVPKLQFFRVMQLISLRLSCLQVASAWLFSSPGKPARLKVLSPFVPGSGEASSA